jgi:PPOX class probable F420-dependent enzyme
MEISEALDFVRQHHFGVLATQRRDGRPQLSNIAYSVFDDDVIAISMTDGRAKTRNLARDSRASLHVTRDDFWAYCVLDCDVELMPVVTDPNDATADALVEYYRRASGEHPDWDEYRATMLTDGRLLARLTPTHAYGMLAR